MKRRNKILIAIVAAALIVSAVATTAALAAAAPPTGGVSASTQAGYQAWGCPMLGGDYSAIATLLGMTVQDIQTQLQQGKSLVEIATTKGVSEDQLITAILEPMKQFMQQQVTAGSWTQAQLDARLKTAGQHVRQLVEAGGSASNQNGYGYGCGMGGMMNGYGATAGGTYRGGMMGGFGGSMMGSWGRSD